MKRSAINPGAKSLERGSTFSAERKPLKRTGDKAPKRRPISPASAWQRRKVKLAPFCVSCGVEGSDWVRIDPAHLVPKSKGGCASDLCVVGLCRYPSGHGCHRSYDDGELDLLRVLTDRWPAERAEVAHMLEHLGPVELVEQLANDRVQWRGAA